MCISTYNTIVGRVLPAIMVNANEGNGRNQGKGSIEHEQGNTACSRYAQETQNSLRYSMSKFAIKMRKNAKTGCFSANLTRKQGENHEISNPTRALTVLLQK